MKKHLSPKYIFVLLFISVLQNSFADVLLNETFNSSTLPSGWTTNSIQGTGANKKVTKRDILKYIEDKKNGSVTTHDIASIDSGKCFCRCISIYIG